MFQNIVMLPSFLLIILGLSAGGSAAKALSSGWLVMLGEASYAFYILQFGVVGITFYAMDQLGTPPLSQFLIALVVLQIVGARCTHLC